MSAVSTKAQIATSGKDALKLLESVDHLMAAGYLAESKAAGVYDIPRSLCLFGFETLLQELTEIVKDYGPDTYFAVISIKCKGIDFKCINMGLN